VAHVIICQTNRRHCLLNILIRVGIFHPLKFSVQPENRDKECLCRWFRSKTKLLKSPQVAKRMQKGFLYLVNPRYNDISSYLTKSVDGIVYTPVKWLPVLNIPTSTYNDKNTPWPTVECLQTTSVFIAGCFIT
jgi:hypothetical protein